jgi:hypothetical protein
MNQAVSMDSVLRPRPTASVQRLDEEMVVLDVQSGRYFGLNAAGALIWEGIERGLALAAIADRMIEEFEVSRETCEADVLRLASELLAEGLVTVAS